MWTLYFCEIQKAFYRTSEKSVEKLIDDKWTKINVSNPDLKYLKWTNLGPF